MPPPHLSFRGIHHVKLATSNIHTTKEFYTTHLPFTHLPALDHKHPGTGAVYAFILVHPTSGLHIEIRDAPEQAVRERGWDPITWAVDSRKDLEDWNAYFEIAGIKCSRVFTAVTGWLLCAEDPDGRRVRLYTLEEHEKMDETDHDAYWLGN